MQLTARATPPGYTRVEQGWFGALLIYTLTPIGVLLVQPGAPAIEFWWDFAMGLGVCAASGLALLPLLSARWWAPQHRATGFLRLIQAVHRDLAYVVLALILAHVGVLLILEPRVVEYLKLGAVAPMLAGLVGTLLIALLITSSRYRDAWHWPYRSWRRWHAGLSVVTLGLVGWHLLGAGYYYGAPGGIVALVWLLALPSLMSWGLRRWPLRAKAEGVRDTGGAERHRAQRLVRAVARVWIAAAVGFGWSGALQAPDEELALCAVDPCL